MTETDTTLTPGKLWKRMTSDQRTRAARAFWQDEEGTDSQVQAVLAIAQQKKFRPKFVLALDENRKAHHLAEQREMMGAFLDALGIAHENGLIKDDEVKPDASKIGSAVAVLREKFPEGDVSLYLDTLVCQDPQTWGDLREAR